MTKKEFLKAVARIKEEASLEAERRLAEFEDPAWQRWLQRLSELRDHDPVLSALCAKVDVDALANVEAIIKHIDSKTDARWHR